MAIKVGWRKITEAQGHLIRQSFGDDFRSFSSCTDPHGEFGEPSIDDEWGLKGSETAMLKAHSEYQRREDFKDGQDYPDRISTQYYIAIITEETEE